MTSHQLDKSLAFTATQHYKLEVEQAVTKIAPSRDQKPLDEIRSVVWASVPIAWLTTITQMQNQRPLETQGGEETKKISAIIIIIFAETRETARCYFNLVSNKSIKSK